MCRPRRELSNAYVLAKFRFDTAENEPSKTYVNGFTFYSSLAWIPSLQPRHWGTDDDEVAVGAGLEESVRHLRSGRARSSNN